MNISLTKIDRSNYQKCIDLKVGSNQQKFVAPNMFSLVQAAYEPKMYPLGIYNENDMIGFILYDFDKDINGWSMSRFMIDIKQQCKGYGKKSLQAFLDYFYSKYGNVDIYTSAEIENKNAIRLYESFGFKKVEDFEYEHNGITYRETRMVLES